MLSDVVGKLVVVPDHVGLALDTKCILGLLLLLRSMYTVAIEPCSEKNMWLSWFLSSCSRQLAKCRVSYVDLGWQYGRSRMPLSASHAAPPVVSST